MQFTRYAKNGSHGWGVKYGEDVHPLTELPVGEPTYQNLTNPRYRETIRSAIDMGSLSSIGYDKIRPLAPVPNPGKIVCVGLNYHDHAEESGDEIPDEPLLFGKAPTCVTNPGSPIVHPPDENVDYEAELAIVIGRTAKDVDATAAPQYVAGYTAVNDVSGRIAQFNDGQFFRGKSYDTFLPMGPTLVSSDGIDPDAVDVRTKVNGDIKQDSNTEQFVFGTHELIEYISRQMTLRPGDVISTGTPSGVGIFRDPPDVLTSGDSVKIEIEGIGTLENYVVSERQAGT